MIITTTEEKVDVPGGKAERPTEIPARGWLQVVKRGWKEAKADQVPLLAAGVAFYAFLAIFPALIAVVTIYGLVRGPGDDREPVELDGCRTAGRSPPDHHRPGHRTELAPPSPRHRPDHLGRDRAVERLGWGQQPADCG